ncbi:SDR family oxidoreductase [Acaryochloris sp. 'Moss Beach']|uniref:SDR family NAD(P)-dependent oxidoreductase n=1 Tax=Acaryochloris sp. 'Moss Beach' TaxID=2740837 RepID=UPI001F2452B5|nr:SDR family NAD(P)-dependent oxidoreductase [Acaryochloris sp. 'Moss Beach']
MDLLFFPLLRVNQRKLQRLLAGKTVLITGASYGIGECLALRLALPTTRLILVARTEEKLLTVQAQVEARGGQADVFPCDLRQPAEVEAFLEQLLQLPNGIDILVNNAGESV